MNCSVTTEQALRGALHSQQGAEQLWAGLIKDGATDEQILENIRCVFGLGGGYASPGGLRLEYKGGSQPWFIHRNWDESGELIGFGHGPKIKGKKLIAMTRKALGISLKTEQLELI